MANSRSGFPTDPELNGMLGYDEDGFLDPKDGDAGRSITSGRSALRRLVRETYTKEHTATPGFLEKRDAKMGSVLSGSVSPV